MTAEEIDQAIRVYLGIGDSGGIQPSGMEERLMAAYGDTRTPAIELALQGYLDQMTAMPVDCKMETLEAATDRAASFAEELIPGLSHSTYSGMSYDFAYQWR